jgi:undecaprenyl phosphate-alpha-L-ara4FN deformylase
VRLGLRIDVDTYRGTKLGVPGLLSVLDKHSVRGTFYFSLGPDNMGRNLWRLFNPSFLMKMLRSKAPGLYGWDIIFKGTFFPGPLIGKNLRAQIKAAADAGHEIGFHAWDHHEWQTKIEFMPAELIHDQIAKGVETLAEITGKAPVSSASPAWKVTDDALLVKNGFEFKFNSDCRGENVFYPKVNDWKLPQLQIPTTLPTYDEIIGKNGVTNASYNEHILSLLRPGKLNTLTIHAEAEGIICAGMFDDFLSKCKERETEVLPMGSMPEHFPPSGPRRIVRTTQPGREGWIAAEGDTVP